MTTILNSFLFHFKLTKFTKSLAVLSQFQQIKKKVFLPLYLKTNFCEANAVYILTYVKWFGFLIDIEILALSFIFIKSDRSTSIKAVL